MKVLHIPFCFYPDPVGGTEVYVEALALHQQEKGLQTVIAVPGQKQEFYSHKGLSVHRFVVSDHVHDLSDLYGKGIAGGAEAFDEILVKEIPDLIHLHAFTPGLSLGILEKAKARRIPVVFTYHTPTVSCQRGTLLRWGTDICDGWLEVRTCGGCTLQGLGVPRTISAVLGRVPPAWGRRIGTANLSGGAWTALRMTSLLQQRFETFQSFMDEVDRVVVPCLWARAVLARNGVTSAKISVSRQGLTRTSSPAAASEALGGGGKNEDVLKMAYLGRLEPSKGVDILIRAMMLSKDLKVHLDIYGITQDETPNSYINRLKRLARSDSRIAFRAPVAHAQVHSLLRTYDLLAVPSQRFWRPDR